MKNSSRLARYPPPPNRNSTITTEISATIGLNQRL
jgi:hypothetical protein